MQHIMNHAKAVIVIDHHITSIKEMKSLPAETKVFDMDQSGAVLAWQFFHPDKEMPRFFHYIEDRDLYNWRQPKAEEFNQAFMLEPLELSTFEKMEAEGDEGIERMIAKGDTVLEVINGFLNRICGLATIHEFVWTKQAAVVVNSGMLKSEVGNQLLDMHPDAEFAVVWNYSPVKNACLVSLRSRDNGPDVSVIAQMFGGGGHPNAAAFLFEGTNVIDVFELAPKLLAKSKDRRRRMFGILERQSKLYKQQQQRQRQLKREKQRAAAAAAASSSAATKTETTQATNGEEAMSKQ